jgi:hypothetical protein
MSDDISADLPTFCHISELGPLGYANLHRMLAMSRPLNLWAPSSVLLRDPRCRITPEDFIEYIRNGKIRIAARKKWLTESRKRDEYPWEGARWDPYVDGQIKSIMEEDAGLPRAQRRVVAAGPEQGWTRAQEYVEKNPEAARDWEAILRLDDEMIPSGTRETARRMADKQPNGAVLTVLRDAYNHGSAIGESDAEIPFLLRPEDRAFLDLMAKIQDGEDRAGGGTDSPRQTAVRPDLSELTFKMIEALKKIETDHTNLQTFVGSQEQSALLQWTGAICGRIMAGGAQTAGLDLVHELAEELRRGTFPGVHIADLSSPREATASAATVVDISFAARELLHGVDPIGITGVVAAAFPVGYGICKRMGWVPGSFQGQEWPFLYAGLKASRSTRAKLIRRLENPDEF